MNIFKNKHIVLASVMAPLLGLAAYFAVDALVAEKPHAAKAGQSYNLVEKPNCRRAGGTCGMKNGDFELELGFEELNEDQLFLKLNSLHALDKVMLAVVENETDEKPPMEMRMAGEDGLNWNLEINRPDPDRHRLRLVATSNQSFYFGDIALKFTSSTSATD